MACNWRARGLSFREVLLVGNHVSGGGGGGFLPSVQEPLVFSMELYHGDQLCSKCIRKSFVSFPVNKIQAYKYNILMTFQSAIASTVTMIAGILVCIVVRLPIGLPSAS